eukprot:TRINITY_DN8748_c0_g1_i1.p1 TRINITY_DN8748_c0_g1~~TRINITY_DN8748_c0_g1_i1.p1  ORF type:complete len:114 (+),score=21.84 TRINITY_DN8748_c0_g1_i1:224-565(+)
MIAFHVDELQTLKSRLAQTPGDEGAAARLEHCKLDLGDQKTKRNLKRRAQVEAADELAAHIAFIRGHCPLVSASSSSQTARKAPSWFTFPAHPMRKYRVWEDDELTDLLRADA